MMTRHGTVLVAQSVVIGVLLIVALDQYAHKRVETVGGVNVWGYRGPVARVKQPNEIRIGVLGGSLAFGWGVAASETVAAEVRRLAALVLDRPGKPPVVVSGFTLGAPGLAPTGFVPRLRRLAELNLDVLCVYPDPVGRANGQFLPDARSAVTALTGYVPMLPLVLEEKPAPMNTVGRLLREIDTAAYRLLDGRPVPSGDDASALLQATRDLEQFVDRIVLVLPAPSLGTHSAGYDAVEAQVGGASPRLPVVNLARNARFQQADLHLDPLNLGVAGHAVAAAEIAPAVIELLGRTSGGSAQVRSDR